MLWLWEPKLIIPCCDGWYLCAVRKVRTEYKQGKCGQAAVRTVHGTDNGKESQIKKCKKTHNNQGCCTATQRYIRTPPCATPIVGWDQMLPNLTVGPEPFPAVDRRTLACSGSAMPASVSSIVSRETIDTPPLISFSYGEKADVAGYRTTRALSKFDKLLKFGSCRVVLGVSCFWFLVAEKPSNFASPMSPRILHYHSHKQ